MTQPPVTLAEFRAYLNLVESDADDEELWTKVLTATEMVESVCGPLRPRVIAGRVRPTVSSQIVLPVQPVLSVDALASDVGQVVQLATLELDPGTGIVGSLAGLPGSWYSITYTAGYDPVPASLREAVLVVAEQLWESQRGPASTGRFTGMGDAPPVPRGFAWPNRALQLVEPYRRLAFA